MHKLYLSHSPFIAQEASVCQVQLHPLWCCSRGQSHLVHNHSKVLNFNKPYFSNQSTLLDGSPVSLTGKLTIWHPVTLMSYRDFEQSLIKIGYTAYTALQFTVQFAGQMHLLALPLTVPALWILLNTGCRSHWTAAKGAVSSSAWAVPSPQPLPAHTGRMLSAFPVQRSWEGSTAQGKTRACPKIHLHSGHIFDILTANSCQWSQKAKYRLVRYCARAEGLAGLGHCSLGEPPSSREFIFVCLSAPARRGSFPPHGWRTSDPPLSCTGASFRGDFLQGEQPMQISTCAVFSSAVSQALQVTHLTAGVWDSQKHRTQRFLHPGLAVLVLLSMLCHTRQQVDLHFHIFLDIKAADALKETLWNEDI